MKIITYGYNIATIFYVYRTNTPAQGYEYNLSGAEKAVLCDVCFRLCFVFEAMHAISGFLKQRMTETYEVQRYQQGRRR